MGDFRRTTGMDIRTHMYVRSGQGPEHNSRQIQNLWSEWRSWVHDKMSESDYLIWYGMIRRCDTIG
jgi:hypothetical protein